MARPVVLGVETMALSFDERLIEWTDDGYPTEESLKRLSDALRDKDVRRSLKAFYAALHENHYPDYCGPDRVKVRGHVIDVWAYHTGGWSGNEQIIGVLQSESFMWGYLLERYDAGGHFYFKPLTWLEQFLGQADSSDS